MTLLLLISLLTAPLSDSPAPPLARAPRQGNVYVVAHRGVHDGIPENTLAAYRAAIDAGADFVEVDIRETKDGHLVSMHNATVDAYTPDATGPVSELTLEELRALDIGSRVGPEWREERIPTLEEILALCKGRIGIYLDLKQAPVEKAVALLRQYEMVGETVWYAGAKPLRELRACCPECLPMPDPGAERGLDRLLRTQAPRIIASSWDAVSASFVARCHAAHAIVIVDDGGPESWPQLLAWGVNGIQTDHVADLIASLKARETSAP